MVLTHAHLDHCGRLPLLVKNGFEKPIYMTDMTKSIIYLMLNDYITIMEENREKALNEFKKIRTLANKYFYAIEANEKLVENGLTAEEKDKITSQLQKKF
jgi:predicted metal-dependent RNase